MSSSSGDDNDDAVTENEKAVYASLALAATAGLLCADTLPSISGEDNTLKGRTVAHVVANASLQWQQVQQEDEEEEEEEEGMKDKTSSSNESIHEEIINAKILERPEYQSMAEWSRHGYGSESFSADWQDLRRGFKTNICTVERLNKDSFGAQQWDSVVRKPCVIVEAGHESAKWPRWTAADLLKEVGNLGLRVSDCHGALIGIETYINYINTTKDDSPMSIYDSQFASPDCPLKYLYDSYQPAMRANLPSCCEPFNDLLDVVKETTDRPPWRWLILGAERGGTGLHIDPLDTTAWVTLCSGMKKWCFLDPAGLTPEEYEYCMKTTNDLSSLEWFLQVYPIFKEKELKKGESTNLLTNDDVTKSKKVLYECVQYPGETVWTPAGWPHVVLNLEHSLAVTHNYCPKPVVTKEGDVEKSPVWDDIIRVLQSLEQNEPAFFTTFLNALAEKAEALYLILCHKYFLPRWRKEQALLAGQVIMKQPSSTNVQKTPRTVAGVDISFDKDSDLCVASLIVLQQNQSETSLEWRCIYCAFEPYHSGTLVAYPYIAGFLAFREKNKLLDLLNDYIMNDSTPDLDCLFVDGNGILHPQRCGLACHLGIAINVPTVGCGKNLLHLDEGLNKDKVHDSIHSYRETNPNDFTATSNDKPYWLCFSAEGTVVPIDAKNAVCASFFSSKSLVKPIYLSVGHNTNLSECIHWTQHVVGDRRYRIPEPIRQADLRSREYIRQMKSRNLNKGAKADIDRERLESQELW
eukprot:g3616.t1